MLPNNNIIEEKCKCTDLGPVLCKIVTTGPRSIFKLLLPTRSRLPTR